MTQSTNQQCISNQLSLQNTTYIYSCRNANAHIFYYNYVLQICLLAFSLNCKFWCPVYFKFAKSRVLFLYWFAFDVSWAPEIVTCIFRTVKLNCNSLNNYIFIDIYYYSWSFLVCSTYCKHHLQPRKVVQGMLR